MQKEMPKPRKASKQESLANDKREMLTFLAQGYDEFTSALKCSNPDMMPGRMKNWRIFDPEFRAAYDAIMAARPKKS